MNRHDIQKAITECDDKIKTIKNNISMKTPLLDKLYYSGQWLNFTSADVFGYYFDKYYDSDFSHAKPEFRDTVQKMAELELELVELEKNR